MAIVYLIVKTIMLEDTVSYKQLTTVVTFELFIYLTIYPSIACPRGTGGPEFQDENGDHVSEK